MSFIFYVPFYLICITTGRDAPIFAYHPNSCVFRLYLAFSFFLEFYIKKNSKQGHFLDINKKINEEILQLIQVQFELG